MVKLVRVPGFSLTSGPGRVRGCDILRINFAKIHTDSEVVLSITLLFGRMLSLVKRFH